MTLQTEFDFLLPKGYLDGAGQLHQDGRLRLATALDESEAARDPRAQANEAYVPVILLSRVITRLGSLPAVTPQVIERLFASDLAYLEDLYLRLNSYEIALVEAVCPHCSTQFQLQVSPIDREAE